MTEKLPNIEAQNDVSKEKLIQQPSHEQHKNRIDLKEVDIEELRKVVESHSKSGDNIVKDVDTPSPVHHHYLTKQIKNHRYKEVLINTRTRLSKNDQLFSKIIHNEKVEKVSDIAEKSVARPSGVISGAIVAIAGAVIVFYFAQKIGFSVPRSIIIILFLLGFIVGLATEFFYKLIKKLFNRFA
jgi:F0F1-type ATP synthase assembly protein I